MNSEIVKLKDIKPCKYNHRVIEKDAVNAVKSSIEQYGFNVPILINKEGVIIAGHVRYMALKELKQKEVLAIRVEHLSKEQEDKLRVLDNAIGDLSYWDMGKLELEMRYIKDLSPSEDWGAFSGMFDDKQLEGMLKISMGGKLKPITEEEIEKEIEGLEFNDNRPENKNDRIVKCPNCGKEFKARIYVPR